MDIVNEGRLSFAQHDKELKRSWELGLQKSLYEETHIIIKTLLLQTKFKNQLCEELSLKLQDLATFLCYVGVITPQVREEDLENYAVAVVYLALKFVKKGSELGKEEPRSSLSPAKSPKSPKKS